MALQTFHQFPLLPMEIQDQIWAEFLPPPVLVKVTCLTEYGAGGSHQPAMPARLRVDVSVPSFFSTLAKISHRALPQIKPIHLRALNNTEVTTVYLRPTTDILCLDNLNIDNGYDIDFIASRNAQHLRVLGITATTVSESISLSLPNPRGPDCGFSRLVKALDSLEVIYLLRGEEDYTEWSVGRMQKVESILWGLAAEADTDAAMRSKGVEMGEKKPFCLVWQDLSTENGRTLQERCREKRTRRDLRDLERYDFHYGVGSHFCTANE